MPLTPDQEMIEKLEAINATQAARLDVEMNRITVLEAEADDLTNSLDNQAERIDDQAVLLNEKDKHILALERIIRLQDDVLKEQGAQLQFYQEGRH